MRYEILCHIDGVPILRKKTGILAANKDLADHAKALRKAGVLSEVLFWQQVRNGSFHKIDFDRQRVIGNYIVDFYVKALGLVVEIDGSSHDYKGDYDLKRDIYLEGLGLKIFKTSDISVKKEIGNVMRALECFIIQCFGRI